MRPRDLALEISGIGGTAKFGYPGARLVGLNKCLCDRTFLCSRKIDQRDVFCFVFLILLRAMYSHDRGSGGGGALVLL